MTTRREFLVVAGGALSLAAAPAWAQGRPVVVCVSYPLAWFAERLAGDLVDVRFPVPADVDPSFWRPGIAEIAAIQTADLIVLNGAGFAGWTTKTTLPRARTTDTSAGFANAYLPADAITHSHGGDGAHSHTGTASYTWLDFAQATAQAEALAAELKRLLPETGADIDDNLAALTADLGALHAMANEVGTMAEGVPVIASHPRYQYFARTYGVDLTYVEWDTRESAAEEQWAALEQQIADTDARLFIWEAEPSVEDRERITALGLVSVVYPPLANRPETGDFLSGMEQSINSLRGAVEEVSSG